MGVQCIFRLFANVEVMERRPPIDTYQTVTSVNGRFIRRRNNILYEKKMLGNATPKALTYTHWLHNIIHFGLRGVKNITI